LLVEGRVGNQGELGLSNAGLPLDHGRTIDTIRLDECFQSVTIQYLGKK
jgi:hypothetical protein